jgi:CheY-like chemotaxis protein
MIGVRERVVAEIEPLRKDKQIGSSLQARVILSATTAEMVFLDIGMPGMDGYEVARRLRQQPGLESVRLAALTGWGQQEDRRRSAEPSHRSTDRSGRTSHPC